MADDDFVLQKKKSHRDRHSGRKAEKKKTRKLHVQELTDKQRNPKAFTFNSAIRAEHQFRRKQDIETKKQHIPLVDRTPVEPPPVVVAVVGPPKVGKTILIQCLIKTFTRQPLTSLKGPVTLVSGKKRRITLMECNNDINSMIDIAKVADLVLLLVDASFGFEMEIFEFLNICQVHGMPRVMGVLTHLDMLKNNKQLKKTKKTLKHRFWTEVYAGAKLFYLSGLLHGEYLRNEVKNLGRFISVMKFRPLTWRTTHPYIVVDRLEDLTPLELIRQNPKVDRVVSFYGFVRGVSLNKMSSVHIPGCGDLKIYDVSHLPDPCPLPDKLKKRSLVEKEKLVYAPFSGIGGIVYDKDAVYVELGGSHSYANRETVDPQPETTLVNSLLGTQETLDMKMARSELQLITGTTPIVAADLAVRAVGVSEEFVSDSGRIRRKVVFPMKLNDEVKHEERTESGCDEGSKSDETEPEIESASDSFIDSYSESESDDEKEVVRKPEPSNVEYKEALPVDEDHSKDKINLGSENKRKRQKEKGALAEAECKLLDMMGEDADDLGSEYEEDSHMHDESSDEIPTKKRKLTYDELRDNQFDRYHGIGSDQDHEIHAKISRVLTRLEMYSKQHKEPTSDYVDSELLTLTNEGSIIAEDMNLSNEGNQKQTFALKNFSAEEDSSDEDYNEYGSVFLKQGDNLSLSSGESDGNNFRTNKVVNSDTSGISGGGGGDDDDYDYDYKGPEESAVRWKANLALKAADAFLERQSTTHNLWKLVYGNYNKFESEVMDMEHRSDSGRDEDVGGIFHIVRRKQQRLQEEKDLMDAVDCARFSVKQIQDWTDSEVCDTIRDCFVTGKWKGSEDAAELLQLDDDSGEEVFGDFEDLETGEQQTIRTESINNEEKMKGRDEERKSKTLTREELQEKKRKLKEKFDSEYDEKDGGKTYYDELRQQVDQQAQLNKKEFESLDDSMRIQLEGFRPGMYVRVEFKDVPCELITNFDSAYPLILGGLLAGEENVGFVQVRIKKHRWYKKILKTRDPLIISLGWRRFQTLPVYSKLEDNLKSRMLKYTPEHVTCMANFWGPITPQNTGFLAVQDVATVQHDFRIAATGSVVEMDKSTKVMKKLKLIGTPFKIYRKTAFIRDMFSSALEVAKFEGAKLKTVSGIRGQIKKAASKPDGAFRATFEDKILLSDIVFCRTWYQVEVPKLYNPLTSLLLPPEQKNQWRGMKTTGQLKREKGIRCEPAIDSLYTPIERQPKVFRPLVIPRTLQKELPYKDKPKNKAINEKKNLESKRLTVVREPHEHRAAALMKMLKVSYSHKQKQLKAATKKRMEEHKKEMEKEDLRKLKRHKELRKQVFRTLSKLDMKNKSKPRR